MVRRKKTTIWFSKFPGNFHHLIKKYLASTIWRVIFIRKWEEPKEWEILSSTSKKSSTSRQTSTSGSFTKPKKNLKMSTACINCFGKSNSIHKKSWKITSCNTRCFTKSFHRVTESHNLPTWLSKFVFFWRILQILEPCTVIWERRILLLNWAAIIRRSKVSNSWTLDTLLKLRRLTELLFRTRWTTYHPTWLLICSRSNVSLRMPRAAKRSRKPMSISNSFKLPPQLTASPLA